MVTREREEGGRPTKRVETKSWYDAYEGRPRIAGDREDGGDGRCSV
jgi:hypothetical protein